MPSIPYGTSSYERARGGLPALPVVNMIAEESPTETSGLVLQSRPGLRDRNVTMGTGPIKALFRRDGVLSGDLFAISDRRLYRNGTLLGYIDGRGPAQMAGYGDVLFAAQGASLWSWNGTTLSVIPFPDFAKVTAMTVGASRLIAIREDTGKFYWSDPLGTTIDPLSFATAENQPDHLLDVLFIDDVLVLFGAETVEFWPNTGNADLPFEPLEGRVIQQGIRNTGCATPLGSSFAWVTNNHNVCVSSEDNVISNPGLQARIKASEDCALFTFRIDGVQYLALRLDRETQVYSPRAQRWSEFATRGGANWIVGCHASGVMGSAVDGRTFEWSQGHEDAGLEMERRFRAGYPINSGAMSVSNVIVRCNVGQTTYVEGSFADPAVEMRTSRDAGKTWGNWRRKPLGVQGKYRTKASWNAVGRAVQPAFLAEFRVTDPVDWRVSDILINEPFGGC